MDITDKETMTIPRKIKPPLQNRCFNCNKLLGIGDPGNIIIKCPRCSKLNKLNGSAPTSFGNKLSQGKVDIINLDEGASLLSEKECKAKVLGTIMGVRP
jgi:phage FluMu protein Com